MESGNNGTPRTACATYSECCWGDLIEGTKEQLQHLGIGVGLSFPGEVGGARRELNVRDPRGYPVRIQKVHHLEDRFTAYLSFPNWPERPSPEPQYLPHAPGVKKYEYTWFDEYVGSADALAAAGLVRVDQLPGKPGMRKVRVTIFPDGTLPTGAPTANHRAAREPGARCIERASASTYRVQVSVTKEERERRQALNKVAEDAWLRRIRALPRPARLQPMAQARWTSLEAARASAARDIGFQGMLARIVWGAGRPSA
jgi:hypothetical protein